MDSKKKPQNVNQEETKIKDTVLDQDSLDLMLYPDPPRASER